MQGPSTSLRQSGMGLDVQIREKSLRSPGWWCRAGWGWGSAVSQGALRVSQSGRSGTGGQEAHRVGISVTMCIASYFLL